MLSPTCRVVRKGTDSLGQVGGSHQVIRGWLGRVLRGVDQVEGHLPGGRKVISGGKWQEGGGMGEVGVGS